MVRLVGSDGDEGAFVHLAGHRFLSAGRSSLRLKRQEHAVKAKPEPTARVQIGQAKEVEQFVRTTTEHLTFSAKFLHLDFKHHAGVVVKPPCNRQVHGQSGWSRRKSRKRGQGRFQFVERIKCHAVHA